MWAYDLVILLQITGLLSALSTAHCPPPPRVLWVESTLWWDQTRLVPRPLRKTRLPHSLLHDLEIKTDLLEAGMHNGYLKVAGSKCNLTFKTLGIWNKDNLKVDIVIIGVGKKRIDWKMSHLCCFLGSARGICLWTLCGLRSCTCAARAPVSE